MKHKPLSATLECFVRKEQKYLMLQRNPDKGIMPNVWMAPGGRREFCEGLFKAARRELREEANLEIANIRIKATGIAYLKDIDLELHLHMLTADYVSGSPEKHTDTDGNFEWLVPDEIIKLKNLLSELRPIFSHIISDNPEVISYRAVYETGNIMTEFEVENNDHQG